MFFVPDGEAHKDAAIFQQEVEPKKQSRNYPNQLLLESIHVEPKWLRKEKNDNETTRRGIFLFLLPRGIHGTVMFTIHTFTVQIKLGWWFQIFFFHLYLGKIPIFFKGVETTNQNHVQVGRYYLGSSHDAIQIKL